MAYYNKNGEPVLHNSLELCGTSKVAGRVGYIRGFLNALFVQENNCKINLGLADGYRQEALGLIKEYRGLPKSIREGLEMDSAVSELERLTEMERLFLTPSVAK
jgi:hypothetical protein